MTMSRMKLVLTLLIPSLTLLAGCASMADEKAHLGEEVYSGIKVGQQFKFQPSGALNLESEICTDIEAFDIHQQVIKDLSQKKLGAVMAEGDIATSGRLLPLVPGDTIGVLYSSDEKAKAKELVRVKIVSTKMQGIDGKSGWLARKTIDNRSIFSPAI